MQGGGQLSGKGTRLILVEFSRWLAPNVRTQVASGCKFRHKVVHGTILCGARQFSINYVLALIHLDCNNSENLFFFPPSLRNVNDTKFLKN